MSFLNLGLSHLDDFKALLKSENLCYDDLANVTILRIKKDKEDKIQAGYGLEVFGANALLRSVIVAPYYRGSGAGIETVEDALSIAKASGIETIFLLTTTADKFFLKLGFEPIARNSVPESIAHTKEFRDFCPDTAICMKLEMVKI